MDNKLRIKRVKEGIKLLESGIDPAWVWCGSRLGSQCIKEDIGVNQEGCGLLYVNQLSKEARKHGFKDRGKSIMLHNWRRFLELIENIK